MKSDSMMWHPPGSSMHSNMKMVAASVIPALSPTKAPKAAAMAFFVAPAGGAPRQRAASFRVKGAGRDGGDTDLLQRVVKAQEADEESIAEGDSGPIVGAHAHPIEASAPHVRCPGPVPGCVEGSHRRSARGAAGLVMTDGEPGIAGGEVAIGRFRRLRAHDLLAGEDGHSGDVVVQ